MTILWSPDTCDCILEIDTAENFVEWDQKCDLHKALDAQALVDAVKTHCKTFEIAIGQQGNAEQRETNVASKRAEKASIKAGGPTTKNPNAPRRFRG